MGKSIYTKEIKDKIVELYVKEGKNTVEIAKMYNTYNTSIRRILIERNVQLISTAERLRKVNLEIIKSQEGTSDFDYFLGILATDGCITRNNVVLEFSEANKDILNQWNEFLGNACSITCYIHKKYKVPQYRIAFKNQDICNYLYDFGITPRKSMTLKLKYINWDVLRGIIDGDGCVREQNYGRTITIEISSSSKIFLEQIQQFLKEHEIKSYLRTIKGNKDNDKHVLAIYKSNNVLKIYDCLYQNAHFFLNRKKLKYGSLLKKFNRQLSVNSGKE